MKTLSLIMLWAAFLLSSCNDSDKGINIGPRPYVDENENVYYYNFEELTQEQQLEYITRLEGVWEMEGPRSTDGLYYYVIQTSTGISMETSNLVDNILIHTPTQWYISVKHVDTGEIIRLSYDKEATHPFFFEFIEEDVIKVKCFDSDKRVMTLGILRPKNDIELLSANEINQPLAGIWKEAGITDGRPVSYLVFNEEFYHCRYTFNGDEQIINGRYIFENELTHKSESTTGYVYKAYVRHLELVLPLYFYFDRQDELWYKSEYAFSLTRTSPNPTHDYQTYGWQRFERIDELPQLKGH